MSITVRFFRWHRWVGHIVALQVLAWVLGGLVFAWLPFQAWVKGGDAVGKPNLPLPANWAGALATASLPPTPALAVQSVATSGGPAIRLRYADGERWLSAAGGELPPADSESVARYARTLYRGGGE